MHQPRLRSKHHQKFIGEPVSPKQISAKNLFTHVPEHSITDADSVVRCTEEKAERASLDEKDAFLVDIGHTIFVWIGKGATKREG